MIEPLMYHQNREQWIELSKAQWGEDHYKKIEEDLNKIIDYFDYFIDISPVILYNNVAIPVRFSLTKSITELISDLEELKKSNHVMFLHSLNKLYVKNKEVEDLNASYNLRYIAVKSEEVF